MSITADMHHVTYDRYGGGGGGGYFSVSSGDLVIVNPSTVEEL